MSLIVVEPGASNSRISLPLLVRVTFFKLLSELACSIDLNFLVFKIECKLRRNEMNIIITKAGSQQIQPIVKVLVENGNQVTRVVRHIMVVDNIHYVPAQLKDLNRNSLR